MSNIEEIIFGSENLDNRRTYAALTKIEHDNKTDFIITCGKGIVIKDAYSDELEKNPNSTIIAYSMDKVTLCEALREFKKRIEDHYLQEHENYGYGMKLMDFCIEGIFCDGKKLIPKIVDGMALDSGLENIARSSIMFAIREPCHVPTCRLKNNLPYSEDPIENIKDSYEHSYK